MHERFKIFITGFAILVLLSTVPANAQLLQDKTVLSLVKREINYIYNMQFENAREVHTNINRLYPDHPVVFLLNGLITYWKNYPMLYTSSARDSFETDMRHCIMLCESKKDMAYEAEYLLANLCARGMLLKFYADNDLSMEVIPLTISTYKYLRFSFDFVSVCSDLNYFTGAYNYYIIAYPEEYPVYKPLSLLFPGGDIGVGLKQLQTAASNSIVLRAESYFLLSYIYFNYENNCHEAILYSKSLFELCPGNKQYRALYIRNLLLMRNYDDAERLIAASTDGTCNRYFQAQLTIFKGILYEKKYLENKLAQEYYIKGISDISLFGVYGNEYAAYAYFGLSRISEANGGKNDGKKFQKRGMNLADFKGNTFDK
jgi:hypothetical protein